MSELIYHTAETIPLQLALTIADYPVLYRLSKGEIEGDELVQLLERLAPGASSLPITEMPKLIRRIADELAALMRPK